MKLNRVSQHISKIVNSLFQVAIVLKFMKLSQLRSGEKGRIKEFQSTELQLKLMEMGCIPGEEIIVEQIAPLGDPISVKVAGYFLSLRLNEADQIILEK